MEGADRLVEKTLEIVEYFRPKLWWIENPRHGFLRKRSCVQKLPFIDVDYCQFSDWGYPKPTRFWGSENLAKLSDRVCDGRTCPNLVPGEGERCHREKLGGYGMQFGTQKKWRTPKELVEYLLTALTMGGEEKFGYLREDYAVRKIYMEEIEWQFQVKAERDCFASVENRRCQKFYTEEDNALKKAWRGGETLWMNPPWTLWPEVVKKLQISECRTICICPDWEVDWVKKLLNMAVKKMYFPEGTKLFEVNGKISKGTNWGVWALLIDKRQFSPPEDLQKAKSIRLKMRMLKKSSKRGRFKALKKDRQLLMHTQVELMDGEEKAMDILVDTGAEANLIRQGLVGDHLMYVAKEPLKFETANGQALAGRGRCTKVMLKLLQSQNGGGGTELVEYEIEFYEANIKVDAIISYPWLAETKLGIFPHHKALVKDSPDLIFLQGVKESKSASNFGSTSDFVGNVSAHEVLLFDLRKMALSMPMEGFDQKIEFLSGDMLKNVAHNLEKVVPLRQQIHHMIVAREGVDNEDDTRVTNLRERVLSDYDGTVFRSAPYPDPPVRGPYGYAYIPLKEGAKPIRQKPFFLHGERKVPWKK
jgi:hypothetical protein